jgi:hypothetical protein
MRRSRHDADVGTARGRRRKGGTGRTGPAPGGFARLRPPVNRKSRAACRPSARVSIIDSSHDSDQIADSALDARREDLPRSAAGRLTRCGTAYKLLQLSSSGHDRVCPAAGTPARIKTGRESDSDKLEPRARHPDPSAPKTTIPTATSRWYETCHQSSVPPRAVGRVLGGHLELCGPPVPAQLPVRPP